MKFSKKNSVIQAKFLFIFLIFDLFLSSPTLTTHLENIGADTMAWITEFGLHHRIFIFIYHIFGVLGFWGMSDHRRRNSCSKTSNCEGL